MSNKTAELIFWGVPYRQTFGIDGLPYSSIFCAYLYNLKFLSFHFAHYVQFEGFTHCLDKNGERLLSNLRQAAAHSSLPKAAKVDLTAFFTLVVGNLTAFFTHRPFLSLADKTHCQSVAKRVSWQQRLSLKTKKTPCVSLFVDLELLYGNLPGYLEKAVFCHALPAGWLRLW